MANTRVVAFAASLAVMISACAAPVSDDDRLNVVATVSPIANIAYNIGGDRVHLIGLVPEGVNSHTFEPAPSDALRLAAADVIFVNGLDLEEPTIRLAEANLKAGAEIVRLADQTIAPDEYVYDFSFPREAGSPNPHLWMNPAHALRYAEIIRDVLARRDPENADFYGGNFDQFKTRVEALDDAMATSLSTIPEGQRRLLTYHDSFAYFAPRYGLTVIGAIQPSGLSEPSAHDVAALITQLRAEGVPTIFGSEVFPSTVLDQIAREAGVEFVDTLRDDDLPGEPGDPEHSYLGLLVENTRVITSALGGDPSALNGIDTTNIPGPYGP